MTRQEHLRFCKVCIHQKKDLNAGIVCDLTGNLANFDGECTSFEKHILEKEMEKNHI